MCADVSSRRRRHGDESANQRCYRIPIVRDIMCYIGIFARLVANANYGGRRSPDPL